MNDNRNSDDSTSRFLEKKTTYKFNLKKAIDELASPLLGGTKILIEESFENAIAKVRAERPAIEAKALTKQMHHQKVIDEVVTRAIKTLQNLQTNDDTESDEIKSQAIDDDWLNIFYAEAGLRNADEIKETFARILAGEIRQPGKFSIGTLRTVSALDEESANVFVRAASACIQIYVSIPIQDNFRINDARIPALDGQLGDNFLQNYGLSYTELIKLIEHGLIVSDLGSWGEYRLALNDARVAIYSAGGFVRLVHQNQLWSLMPQPEFRLDEENGLRLYGAKFSSVGRELLEVVDIIPMQEFSEKIARYFNTLKLDMKSLGNIA
ncbi:MAG: DUF2806 domain-containing protein [Gammaproteobacteria bacterium]|nr:DUF2806 domain-containing protein [Gammaproteobacteria bacterium]